MNRTLLGIVGFIIGGAGAPASTGVPTLEQYLKASNVGAEDVFGQEVDISGDTLVVGAPFESGDASSTAASPNDNLLGAGAAYVFVRNGDRWEQQAYLKASNPDEFDIFGGSVAISGDTIVVGSNESGDAASTMESPNDNAFASGAAYVFERTGTTWEQTAYLKASNTESGDIFASSVAIAGDTIVVGAFGEDGGAGAVYIYERDGGGWMQTAYLKASNGESNDSFGTSVAICGDTLIAGAWREAGDETSTAASPNNRAPFAGAAYIFKRNAADRTWSEQAYLKASNAEAEDQFGVAVAISGDHAVVGAIFEDGDASSTVANPNNALEGSGAAYVFERSGTTWTQSAYLKANQPGENYNFGASGLAIEGGTLVVSSPGEDPVPEPVTASGAGAAYVFQRFGVLWSQTGRFQPPGLDTNQFDDEDFLIFSGDQFAFDVAISGGQIVATAPADAGDASSTLAAPNNNAFCAGAVYVYSLGAPPISSITNSPGGVFLEMPVPCNSTIGVEYSADFSAGSWTEIGEFLDPESDGIGTFTDRDATRRDRDAGFYRGVFK